MSEGTRNREVLLSQWDAIRRKIADGCTNDGPSLWFEGVLDDRDDALSAENRRLREALEEIAGHAFRGSKLTGSCDGDLELLIGKMLIIMMTADRARAALSPAAETKHE